MRGMKKILAMLLCLAMLMACLPVAYATSGDLLKPGEPEWEAPENEETTEPEGDINIPIEDLFGPKMVGIEVATLPTKTVYERGEALDATGLTLTALYEDASTKPVTDGFTVSGFESETIGTKTVTVTYGDFTATFQVEVEAAPARILVVPSKTEVARGETLTVTVSVTGDEAYTALGYIPFCSTTGTVFEIIDAQLLEAAAAAEVKNISVTEGGVLAFTDAAAYTGEMFRFDVKIRTDAAVGTYYLTDAYNMMNQTQNIDVALVDTAITVVKPTTVFEEQDTTVNDSGNVTISNGSAATGDVVIGDTHEVAGEQKPVTEIGANAFADNQNITSVEIPETVTVVGENAFAGCTNLTEITVMGKTTDIQSSGIASNANVVIKAPAGSLAHDYAKEHSLKFQAILDFYTASVVLYDNLGLKYKVDRRVFDKEHEEHLVYDIDSAYVIFEINGQSVKVDTYTTGISKTEAGEVPVYIFEYRDIAPNQMQSGLTGTLYAMDSEDYLCTSQPKAFSVKQYCDKALENSSTAENETLRTLLVDMLYYGAAAEAYTGANVSSPASGDLTEEQKGWATAQIPEAANGLNTKHKECTDAKATFKSAGLYLEDTVAIRFGFTAESVKGLTVKVEYTDDQGEAAVAVFTANDFVKSGNRYYIYFNNLIASQMREMVYATVYEGEVAVSNTIAYSIETYVAQVQAQTNADSKLVNIVNAMLCYGNAAAAYVGK